jgi:hypothetical protein
MANRMSAAWASEVWRGLHPPRRQVEHQPAGHVRRPLAEHVGGDELRVLVDAVSKEDAATSPGSQAVSLPPRRSTTR